MGIFSTVNVLKYPVGAFSHGGFSILIKEKKP